MAIGDTIKCKALLERKPRYYNEEGGFGIVQLKIIEDKFGNIKTDKFGNFIVKGEMPEPIIDTEYNIVAEEMEDPKWGLQYKCKSMSAAITIAVGDKDGQRKFLEHIFTEAQVENMYQALDNPFEAFEKKKTDELVKIKGCGFNTVVKWQKKFEDNLQLAKVFRELEDYNLTNNMVKKLLEKYQSPDLIIQKVKNNPYILCEEVDGVGWATADKIALNGGMEEYDPKRIASFINHYLKEKSECGYSYITTDELMGALLENLGEDLPDEPIGEAINNMKQLWWSEDKEYIGLKRFKILADNIATELIRIRDCDNTFKYDNWRDKVKQLETNQGWDYTDEQIEGIQAVLENQVVLITGLAGCGKTTIIRAMLEAISKDYYSSFCALSGKAAARITEVTGHESHTIHRLLGFPKGQTENQGYVFHSDNKLSQDIIIVDEISMVDAYLFYYLIRAIKDGAKLIMLGDVGQLESIGCGNIAYDILNSPEIKVVRLNKIHRQAAASGIITESRKVYDSIQLCSSEAVINETRGELKDLELDIYSDKSNTFYKCIQYFQKYINQVDNIMDIQVIVPVKTRGDACCFNINNAIQDLYNPSAENKKEITVYYSKNVVGVLRVGDKIINTKNDYKTRAAVECTREEEQQALEFGVDPHEGDITAIFNGFMGIITDINTETQSIVVDFFDVGKVIITKNNIKSIELAYACTGHKMQGSQARVVIVGVDWSSYSLLTKEWVYTALTRAQKHCVLIAQNSALSYAINKQGVSGKLTHLQDSLIEIAHPKLLF